MTVLRILELLILILEIFAVGCNRSLSLLIRPCGLSIREANYDVRSVCSLDKH